MAETLTVVCRACNRPVNMNQVTFDSVKKAYVCNSCHSKMHPSMAPVKKIKPAEEKPSIFGGKSTAKPAVVKYACAKCKYRFSRAKEKPVATCPYCGGKKIEEVTNDASRILADSDNFNF
ncbi:MAG: hypothetical protein ACP5N2_02635 [Candidatus Nanoarchaeia archaeon]